MSKRVPKPRHTLNVALALLAIAFLLSTFTSATAIAARPLISIERTTNTMLGMTEYVDITFNPNGTDFQSAGFDLLISYDESALTLESVERQLADELRLAILHLPHRGCHRLHRQLPFRAGTHFCARRLANGR